MGPSLFEILTEIMNTMSKGHILVIKATGVSYPISRVEKVREDVFDVYVPLPGLDRLMPVRITRLLTTFYAVTNDPDSIDPSSTTYALGKHGLDYYDLTDTSIMHRISTDRCEYAYEPISGDVYRIKTDAGFMALRGTYASTIVVHLESECDISRVWWMPFVSSKSVDNEPFVTSARQFVLLTKEHYDGVPNAIERDGVKYIRKEFKRDAQSFHGIYVFENAASKETIEVRMAEFIK